MTSLQLWAFRNMAEVLLRPCAGANIIYGDNAQGKTNLLEGIWLFTGGRSFRGAKDRDLVQFGAQVARLHLEFSGGGRDQSAELAFGPERKKITLNEITQSRLSDLGGRFCAVAFSPDQLAMVKQGPEGRRRFLDTCLSQILPGYQRVLDSYERILRQRAHLLRDSQFHPALEDQLEVWDSHLCQYGGYMLAMRARYAKRLGEHAAEIYGGISQEKESFSLDYRSTVTAEGEALPQKKEDCAALLAQALKTSRAEDKRSGSTTVGPHRDDLEILVGGVSARAFASQGQQRSCVLALKLAECALMHQTVGESPVVLLDDVMSELDESRRHYLLNHLQERQVFITCCDVSAFKGLYSGKVFHMKQGVLSQEIPQEETHVSVSGTGDSN